MKIEITQPHQSMPNIVLNSMAYIHNHFACCCSALHPICLFIYNFLFHHLQEYVCVWGWLFACFRCVCLKHSLFVFLMCYRKGLKCNKLIELYNIWIVSNSFNWSTQTLNWSSVSFSKIRYFDLFLLFTEWFFEFFLEWYYDVWEHQHKWISYFTVHIISLDKNRTDLSIERKNIYIIFTMKRMDACMCTVYGHLNILMHI